MEIKLLRVHKHPISPHFSAPEITVFPPLQSLFIRSHQHPENLFGAHFHLRVIPKSPFTQAKPNGTIYKIITIQPSWPDFHNKHQPGIVVAILFGPILFLFGLRRPVHGLENIY